MLCLSLAHSLCYSPPDLSLSVSPEEPIEGSVSFLCRKMVYWYCSLQAESTPMLTSEDCLP
jgi:hypothetical protein